MKESQEKEVIEWNFFESFPIDFIYSQIKSSALKVDSPYTFLIESLRWTTNYLLENDSYNTKVWIVVEWSTMRMIS